MHTFAVAEGIRQYARYVPPQSTRGALSVVGVDGLTGIADQPGCIVGVKIGIVDATGTQSFEVVAIVVIIAIECRQCVRIAMKGQYLCDGEWHASRQAV